MKNLAEKSSSTLVDPSLVSVIGVAKDSGVKSSKEASTIPAGAKAKKMDKSLEAVSSTPEVAKAKKTQKTPDSKVAKEKNSKKWHSSPVRSSAVTTDSKLEAMDLKWSERFSRLEAMLLSKSLSQSEPSFQPVKITPVKPPPAGAVDNTEPFFALTRSTDRPTSAQQQASDQPQQVDRPFSTNQPSTDSAFKPSVSTSGVEPTYRSSDSDMDTDSVTDTKSLPRVMGNTEGGELSDIEQDVSLTDADQALSEEQNYRETMRGIRSYMGWSHIPDVDSALSSSEDNPFAAPKQQPTGSVNLPTDDWLCRKMDRLKLTLIQGYPSRSSEAGGLQRDQFVKPPKSQVK